jgi:hypothetical protein
VPNGVSWLTCCSFKDIRGIYVKNTLVGSLALILFVLASIVAPTQSFAVYGGNSADSTQVEDREDDNYYGGCYTNACPGRCGPGCSAYFGTTVTYACQQHDNCIRDYKCSGYSGAEAHYYCLSGSRGLGKAAASLGSYHWQNAKTWLKDTWQNWGWAQKGV